MSIEVQSHYKPARPNLAILVSGLLLAMTLGGAGLLTYSRNRPISLAEVQNIPAVQGLRMAWPADWTPVQPPGSAGPIVAGYAGDRPKGSSAALFLLAEQVRDTYISPEYAAHYLLRSAARQLGFQPRSGKFTVATGEMLGQPAYQVTFAADYQQRVYEFILRVASEPDGRAIGLLLIVDERISPSTERIVDAVADSMELHRDALDVAAGLRQLGLVLRSDDPSLSGLRAYVHEMPVAGPTGVTLVPARSTGADRYYAINVWTSWLANRRTLQDIASTWYRRQSREVHPPDEGDWVQRSTARVWKLALTEAADETDAMVDVLYLRELPDRRVVWARATAGKNAGAEPLVLDLLAAVQRIEQPTWNYDVAVTDAGTLLAELADGPVEEYYHANQGRQDFTYAAANGHPDGTGQIITTVTRDGTLTRSERVEIGPQGERFTSQKQSLLRADLSAFQVKDVIQYADADTMQIGSARSEAADPVNVIMQFSRGRPIQSSFSLREPFLPDPAYEPAAWHLARRQGASAVFRIVGMDPQVPESLLLVGLGRQQIDTAGGPIEAWCSLFQEDTSSGPTLVLFDEGGRLIGYVLPSGASFLRKATRLPANR